jgi:hypothetical protein
MIGKDFVLAGRAIFTVANATGDHYTFKVSKKEFDDGGEIYFVGLLTGPANESDYTYMGVLNVASGDVRLTAKSRFTDETLPVKVARWALGLIWNAGEAPAGYAVAHAGKCGACGRTLTDPVSIECGIGPVCRGDAA